MIELLMAFFSGDGAEDEEKRSPVAVILQATVLLLLLGLIVWAIVAW
jgi:hypothetical protein